MKALLQVIVFGGLAAGAHVAAFAVAGIGVGAEGGGDGGDQTLTVLAADAVFAAQVQQWDVPPEVSDAPEVPLVPAADTRADTVAGAVTDPVVARAPSVPPNAPPLLAPAPARVAMPDAPVMPDGANGAPLRPALGVVAAPVLAVPVPAVLPDAAPLIRAAQAPQIETAPAPPPVPDVSAAGATSPRPQLRPADLVIPRRAAKPAKPNNPASAPRKQASPNPTPSAPRAAQTAKGAGKTASAGNRSAPAGQDKARITSLKRAWSAQITAQLQRALRRTGVTGSLRISIRVARDGRLMGVSVLDTSGNARVDAAAIKAAQRIKRYPAAPKGLDLASMSFGVRVNLRP